MTTAKRKGIGRVRREARYRDRIAPLQEEPVSPITAAQTDRADDRLELIFACCHPALSRESQVALTLRSVLGLATAEIARAFVVSEATVARRLGRAHLSHATRAELLRTLGRADEARDADRRALALTENPAERALLSERIGR